MGTVEKSGRDAQGRVSASRNHLRSVAAAAYVGLSVSTLAKMRLRGDGPRYAKSGRRIVVYDVADLDAWLAGRKRHSTSEVGEAP